ncbi:MAG: hypothetical protein ABI579_02745, partial [Candidatus Sumerlaeota bacterium]
MAGNASQTDALSSVSTEAEVTSPSGKGQPAAPAGRAAKTFTVAGTPSVSPDFINFGYLQSERRLLEPMVR